MAIQQAAVLIPGRRYSADGPLLMYAGMAVRRRGGATREIAWEVPDFSDAAAVREWVADQVTRAVDEMVLATEVEAPLLIGKSLGSFAASVAARRGLPAVWFTPLLTFEPAVEALRRASAPCLLIGGTADKLWDGRIARSITPYVVEIDDADHGMHVPGPLAASAAVLGEVMTAVERFLDDVVRV